METEKEVKEEKPAVRRLIRVDGLPREGNGAGSGVYGLSSFNFSFVSAPSEGNRKQATGHMTCREYVNFTVWASYRNTQRSQFFPEHKRYVDFETTRILFVYSPHTVKEFKDKLFNGKAALNLVENVAGWTPSKITTVVHNYYKNAWLLTGPKEWMSQPQLVSLMTWIMRLSSFDKVDVSNYDALEASIKKASISRGSTDAATYASKFWNIIYIMMKYNKEIFDGITLDRAWPERIDDYFGQKSGLLSFVTEKADYSKYVKEAYKRFKDLCEKHLPRKNPLIK